MVFKIGDFMVEIKQIPMGKQTVVDANHFFSLRMKGAREAAKARAAETKTLPKRCKR